MSNTNYTGAALLHSLASTTAEAAEAGRARYEARKRFASALVHDALHTWAESMAMHVHVARMEAEDRAYRATLTPEQLRDYRVHTGELEAECPACGATYVEATAEEHPDMVGTTYTTTFACCGHTSSYNDALEYRAGVAVDVR